MILSKKPSNDDSPVNTWISSIHSIDGARWRGWKATARTTTDPAVPARPEGTESLESVHSGLTEHGPREVHGRMDFLSLLSNRSYQGPSSFIGTDLEGARFSQLNSARSQI